MERIGTPQTRDDTRLVRIQDEIASAQDWIDRHPIRAPVLALCVLGLLGLAGYGLASWVMQLMI
jgi:hypothetical protein